MATALTATARHAASVAAWEVFLADVPMTWVIS